MTGRLVVIGEGLLELSHPPGGGAVLGFGGDTLNTAVYLARLGSAPHFVSALGTDPYSDRLLADWSAEGIGTDRVLRHPERMPGLYAIQTDAEGERSFHYWKADSAARAFWDIEGAAEAAAFAENADWLYFSGITLSLWDGAGRARLAEIASRVRAGGGAVVFDPNYRPRGWADAPAARAAIAAIAPLVSIALPTLDDEDLLHGEASEEAHAARWLDAGTGRVVMKRGRRGARIHGAAGGEIPVPEAVAPTDTTGAGDSFNAGFLAAKLSGADDADACAAGNRLAGVVVRHSGAIVDRAVMPAL